MNIHQSDAEAELLRFNLGLYSLRPINETLLEVWQRGLLDRYRGYADQFLSTIPSRENITTKFAFFDSARINGKAFIDRSTEMEVRFATISSGSIFYFHEFFYYLLSRNDTFSRVGLTSCEINSPYKFFPTQTYPCLTHLRERSLLKVQNPQHPIRKEFAAWLAHFACIYLILHEIGHCINGHVAYSRIAFDEIEFSNEGDYLDSIFRHTLEMDADSFATNQLRREIVAAGYKSAEYWGKAYSHFPQSYLLYPASVAVALLFRIIARPESLSTTADQLRTGSHPHPAIRAHFYQSNMVTLSQSGRLDVNVGEVAGINFLALQHAYTCWADITGKVDPIRMTIFDDSSPKDGFDRVGKYLNELLVRWKVIRPELLKVSITDLPPVEENL